MNQVKIGPRQWIADLMLGIRLAIGGGRGAWGRLALTAAGIGLGVAVLLVAASVTTVEQARQLRAHAAGVGPTQDPIPGVDALLMSYTQTEFRDTKIRGDYLSPTGPKAPLPPGLDRLPGDGESVVSPALADLLASEKGELLRPRFPKVVGTIGNDGLVAPPQLKYYTGTTFTKESYAQKIYTFGFTPTTDPLSPVLWVLVILGVLVLLFPVLVFVAISSRTGGVARDRRLAALRLVGAGSQRVRRIAAGESLLGALLGLVFGVAIFLIGRLFVEDIELLGETVYAADIRPDPVQALVIAVLVPLLSTVTTLVALRRTIIEPLGVVRIAKPIRRKLLWRLVPTVLGGALLAANTGALGSGNTTGTLALVVGIALLLLAVPLLLPWAVERAVGHLSGGTPSWELAIRRLQLDSGTAARVVGGVAVVLAGGIALMTILNTAQTRTGAETAGPQAHSSMQVSLRQPAIADFDILTSELAGTEGVRGLSGYRQADVLFANGEGFPLTMQTCDQLRAMLPGQDCADGDAFYLETSEAGVQGQTMRTPQAGDTLRFVTGYTPDPVAGAEFTLPPRLRLLRTEYPQVRLSGLVITPKVATGIAVPYRHATISMTVDPSAPDTVERVRNSLAPHSWAASEYWLDATSESGAVRAFRTIRNSLLVGLVITLTLLGASLLVLGIEQIRERRRPLAVLAASGVPRATLARSLLWQNLVPVAVAGLIGVVYGTGLATLLLRGLGESVTFDWAGIAVLAGTSGLIVMLATGLTLPALRNATRPQGLRSE